MRVSNFSVLIPQARERDSGQVELPHGTVYTIKLLNHYHDRHCDADVTVDGKSVGSFRVLANNFLELKRPEQDQGCFTFYGVDSCEAAQAGVSRVETDQRGLIQVVFRPQRRPCVPPVATIPGVLSKGTEGFPGILKYGNLPGVDLHASYSSQHTNSTKSRGLSAGITGLSGTSSQTFQSVAALDYDPELTVVISLRLVQGQAVRELVARPLANPIPGVVG